MKSKRASRRRMDSSPNLQPVGMGKKQVTWVAITMLGVLVIALIFPLVLIVTDDDNSADNQKKKVVEIKEKAPKKDRPEKTTTPNRDTEKTPKSSGPSSPEKKSQSPRISNDSFGLSFDPKGETESVTVKEVVDGDSLILGDGRKLRFIGIQAPGGSSIEAKTATAQLQKRVEGKTVVIAFDEKKQDRYKRVLAYVFCDGIFINGWMVGNGLAYESEWKPNTRHTELLQTLQETARSKKRGFWAMEREAAPYYVSFTRSRYFHRPECKRVAKAKSTPDKLRDRDDALNKRLIPCRDCRP